MKWPASEVELARPVIAWLSDLRWDVYQEVSLGYARATADIVAVQQSIVWVVEAKRSFTLDLIEQAESHRRYAHYVSVAVPWRKGGLSSMASRVCNWLGVGVLTVKRLASDGAPWVPADVRVEEREKPALHRRAEAGNFLDRLRPEHKSFAEAGNSNGRRFSPFQATCISIERYVRDHPGASMKEVIDSVETHYRSTATARSCIAKWAAGGVIKGVRIERDGRRIKFYPGTNQ